MMDNKTQKYYADKAAEVSEYYNGADYGVSKYFQEIIPSGSRVLDIGAGSGRDMVRLLNYGYDAYGFDPSPEMVSAAKNAFPVLDNRYRIGKIQSEVPVFDILFDAVICSAVFMHLTDQDIELAVSVIKRYILHGGKLLLSVPLKRDDVDKNSRLPDDRLFILRSPEVYIRLFQKYGFLFLQRIDEDDSLGRSNISWSILVFVN